MASNSMTGFRNLIISVLAVVIGLVIIVISYKAVITYNTEQRSKAAIEDKIYKQWEFEKDIEGWTNSNLLKLGVANGLLSFIVGEDPRLDSPIPRYFGSLFHQNVETKIPAGNKYFRIRLAVNSGGSAIPVVQDTGSRVDTKPMAAAIEKGPKAPCPDDVKQCEDGSFVKRIAPSCEFEKCAKPTCVPRPACLDVEPPSKRCLMPEREDYCPPSERKFSFVVQYQTTVSDEQKQLVLNGIADGTQRAYEIRFPEVGELQVKNVRVIFSGLGKENGIHIDWIRLTGPLAGGTSESHQYIRQTYLSEDGTKLFQRTCEWDRVRGAAGRCPESWDTRPVPALLSTSSSGAGFRSYSGFAYNPKGLGPSDVWNVREILVNGDGTTAYYRTCPVRVRNASPLECTDTWHAQITNNATGNGDKSYRGYGAFVYNTYRRNVQYPQSIRQFYLNEQGTKTYYRTCLWNADRGSAEECSGWGSYDVPSLTNADPPPVVRQYNAFTYLATKEGTPAQKIRQFFINNGGSTSYYRTCDWNISNAAPENCSPAQTWNRADLANVTGIGDQSYRSYSAVLVGDP